MVKVREHSISGTLSIIHYKSAGQLCFEGWDECNNVSVAVLSTKLIKKSYM